ncbi:MAG: hypothetical protein PHD29_07310 [bacterium]|nr:hypothetical protein [bacterium]MDD5757228.1 hypothetical protein [bacterium]
MSIQYGTQPLDAILTELGITNSDLVRASTEQLTHKMVQKGRKGRRLTLHVRQKLLNALHNAQKENVFTLQDLFNYGP